MQRGVAVLAAFSATLVAIAPADAQVDPEVTRLSDDLAAIRRDLETTNASVMSIREEQVLLEGRVRDLTTQIDGFRAAIAATEAEIRALQARRDAILQVLRARAARLYVQRDPISPFDEFVTTAPMKLARRQVLAGAVARRDESTRAALQDTSDKLAAARDELAAQRSALEAQEADLRVQQRALADLGTRLEAERARLDAQARDVQARLQAAIAAGIIRAGGPSILGPTLLSASQMAAWWRAQRYPPANVSISVEELARLYVEEGTAEGVRGDIAFAQAVLETGGFRHTAPGNNFAGMGWCDTCRTGRAFPTPRDGVRAQIQHLKNYGDPTSRAAGLAWPASVYWYAPTSLDQTVANENFDRFFAKGWALTWNQMGNGNWAADPRYADKVLRIYASMVAFAQGG